MTADWPDEVRCANCRWWEPLDYPELPVLHDERGQTVVDGLKVVKHEAPWGQCGKVGMLWPSESDMFYVRDASQYSAWLTTRAEFGCREFEQDTTESELTS